MTYLVQPNHNSHDLAHIQDGHTAMALCGKFLPEWDRKETRPYKVCTYCQRASRRTESTAAKPVALPGAERRSTMNYLRNRRGGR